MSASSKIKNITKGLVSTLAVSSMLMTVASCDHRNSWRVEGTLHQAEADTTLVLERFTGSIWIPIDTLEVKAGRFGYNYPETQSMADVLRLRAGDKTIYFPVDSVETLTVTPVDGGSYRVGGSSLTSLLNRADSLINTSIVEVGVDSTLVSIPLKRQLYNEVIAPDANGVISYYVINKQIQGQPLFTIYNRSDANYFSAVATKMMFINPDDARAKHMETMALMARRNSTDYKGQQVEATVSGLPAEINLYDSYGKQHSLSELAKEGKVIVLSFIIYDEDVAPAYNLELNKVYDKYKDKGLEIYQVSFDGDEAVWKSSARNLPWITVYNSPTDGLNVASAYNISLTGPTTYIINRSGDLIDRVQDPASLDKTVSKYL